MSGLPGFTAHSVLYSSTAIVPMLRVDTGRGPSENTKVCCCWDYINFKERCFTAVCPRESVITCRCDTALDGSAVMPGANCTQIPVPRFGGGVIV